MAPDNTGYGSISMGEQSTATSPTDTRAHHPRFEPITRGNSNEEDPESTVRINRPPVISTTAGMFPPSILKPEYLGRVANDPQLLEIHTILPTSPLNLAKEHRHKTKVGLT